MGPWIGTWEAATQLGVSSGVLLRMIDHGALPAYRVGGAIRLRAADVDDLAAHLASGELDAFLSCIV